MRRRPSPCTPLLLLLPEGEHEGPVVAVFLTAVQPLLPLPGPCLEHVWHVASSSMPNQHANSGDTAARAHPKPNTWPVAMAKLLPLGALVLCALAAAEDVTDTKAPVAVDEPMTPTSSWFGEGTFFHRRCAPFSLFEHRA